MNLRVALVAATGLILALYVVIHIGVGAVLSAAAAVGWGGFAVLCLCALALSALLAVPWYILVPGASQRVRAAWRVFIWARAVREAATDVLPFSALGGLLLGARAAILHGVPASFAFASTIVDVTTEMLAQIAYLALGLALVGLRAPHTPAAASLTRFGWIGLVFAAAAGGALLAMQRRGHGFTRRIAARLLPRAIAGTAAVGNALDAIHASHARVALSAGLHFCAWIASAAATWLAFRLIGVRLDFVSVIAIESLVSAVKSAAALVPNALGAQEAAYALLTPLFGVGAPFGLAVSLLKRARDIAVGVPILLISQALEGRRALAGGTGGDLID